MSNNNFLGFFFEYKEDLHRVLLTWGKNFSPINKGLMQTKREK
jgi:hypothetical protein